MVGSKNGEWTVDRIGYETTTADLDAMIEFVGDGAYPVSPVKLDLRVIELDLGACPRRRQQCHSPTLFIQLIGSRSDELDRRWRESTSRVERGDTAAVAAL